MAGWDKATKRRAVAGSMLGVGVVLGLILFVFANYFAAKYYARFDWTSSRLFTLSEKTRNVLADLDRDVEAVVFLTPADALHGPVNELLASYAAESNRFSTRSVDPEKNLVEAQMIVDRFELTQVNVVVLDSGDDRRVVATADMADYDYSGIQYGQGPTMTGFKGEQVFTSALVELMESRKPRILFTSGHGEVRLEDFSPEGMSLARDLLGKDNFELEDWASLGESTVPDGTDLIVVAGPTTTFLEQELDMLRQYLDGGGRLLVLLDPSLDAAGAMQSTGLESLLAEYGILVGDDIVVDPTSPLPFFGPESFFVTTYGDHIITRSLEQGQFPVVVPLARSIGEGDPVEGIELTEILMTTVDGWGETDIQNFAERELQDEDRMGPVPVAVAVEVVSEGGDEGDEGDEEEIGDGGQSLRIVAVGDSDFASNSQLQNVPNATLLANIFNWLVERESLVGIPPKTPEQVKLSLTASEMSRISWLVLVGLPGLAIALGVTIFLRRRR